jgi:hypothetical protein
MKPLARVRFKEMGNHEARFLFATTHSLSDPVRPELGRRAVERALKMPNDQAQGERFRIGETSLLSKNEIHITHQFESHPICRFVGLCLLRFS